MPTFTRSSNLAADGTAMVAVHTVTHEESSKVSLTLPAAKSGRLTTRTDDNTGVITMTDAGHGLLATDFVSVFWTNPSTGAYEYRHGMDITAVAGADITVDLGQGDNLPPDETDVVVGLVVTRTIDWDGTTNGLKGVAASSGQRASVALMEAALLAGTDFFKHLTVQSPGYMWLAAYDGAFPGPAGDFIRVQAASGYISGATEMTVVSLDQ